jgi:sugar lactone lactonase YvrE
MRILSVILTLFALVNVVRAQDSVTTFAGQPLVSGAANGVGTNALFSDPAAIVVDANGNCFVADSQNHAIRKITSSGVVTTVAGQLGVAGTANGTGTNAQFNSPNGLALDASGILFVGDTGNNVIRKITAAGGVSTFAGLAGQSGFLDGPAGAALFNSPLGMAIATNGDLFVADCGNHCIRRISGGTVTTFAGNPQIWGSADGVGTNAQFNGPVGIVFDAGENLFVADANNHTIRKITPAGTVSTWAGKAGIDGYCDGVASAARFCKPAELAMDTRGNLFVADSFNHVIRKVSSNGVVSTVSGSAGNYGVSDGVNGQARFFNPYGLVVSPGGALLVADAYNQSCRVVLPPFNLSIQPSTEVRTMLIVWNGVTGQTYQVQFKDTLTATNWSNLGPAEIATNQSLNYPLETTGVALQRVYRVTIP